MKNRQKKKEERLAKARELYLKGEISEEAYEAVKLDALGELSPLKTLYRSTLDRLW